MERKGVDEESVIDKVIKLNNENSQIKYHNFTPSRTIGIYINKAYKSSNNNNNNRNKIIIKNNGNYWVKEEIA